MPILIILIFSALFTYGVLIAIIYFFREWYLFHNTIYNVHAVHCLYAVFILLFFSLFGKLIIKSLFSTNNPKTEDPEDLRSHQKEQITRPDGSKISIESFGDIQAQPILFVHGWNANSTEWFYQKRRFSNKYRVIVYDLPGLGQSMAPSNNDFSLQKMAEDLKAVIAHLKLSNVYLWGHSMGGMIILTYCCKIASDQIKGVKGIILQHTTYTNPVRTSILNKLLTIIEKPVLRPLCYLMIAFSPIIWINKWMGYFNGTLLLTTRFIMFTGKQTPNQLEFISRLSALSPPHVFARGMLAMMKTYDVTDNLDHLNINTLILGGYNDRLTKLSASEFMHSRIPNSVFNSTTNAGHQGLAEQHTYYNDCAQKFIESTINNY